MVNVRKRGNVYEYRAEVAPVDGKRKWISKSGYGSKKEAKEAGIKAYNEYLQTGHSFTPSSMSYTDYLDYWMKEHCEINLKYHTIQAYKNIIKNHVKPRIGSYMLSQITTATLQEFVNNIYLEKGFSKSFLKNILKVLKTSFSYATDVVGFIKENPALKVRLPRYDIPESDPAHIFTKEEINMILERFENNHAFYYAALTAYYTGLRVSEVYALTWDDIDLENKTLTVNKNVLEKNQSGATHGRHISGKAKTMWYFGTCKTSTSYRTIDIGDTLVNALKEYKQEQEKNRIEYGDSYMKHYAKEVTNQYTNKPETKIINAYAELDVALPEVNLVFVKKNGVFEGTATVKYPFKVIHYELGINCRFHDFRDTHATRLIEAGADIKAVSKRLGHSTIRTTYEIYVRVTSKMENDTVERFEQFAVNL
ncbi:MAG: tyrosine-type recombinase/integrase [Clostridia bacterium]|nr:tyrosine-type recombinase/integrase [Clostridia bacterium]